MILQIKSDDGLPHKVCMKCVSDVEAAFAYKTMCEENDVKLRDYFRVHLASVQVKLEIMDSKNNEMFEANWLEPVNTVTSEEVFANDFHSQKIDEVDDAYANISLFAPSDDDDDGGLDEKAITMQNGESSRTESVTTYNTRRKKQPKSKETTIIDNDSVEVMKTTTVSHSKVTNVKKPKYSCEVCLKPFKFLGDYKRHKSFHNEDAKRFTCDICGGKYTRKYNIR